MYKRSGNNYGKKNSAQLTRKDFTKSSINNIINIKTKRRRSSKPLQLKEFRNKTDLNKKAPDPLIRKSVQNNFHSKKKYLRDIINTSIPEVSENSSNNKDKKDIENNNFYIHYIKNVYEKEPHLNKKSILNNKSNIKEKINNTYLRFLESNKNVKPINWRRNSCLNKNYLNNNYHDNNNLINFILDKENLNSKKAISIINKKNSTEIGSLFHKRKLGEKEKFRASIHKSRNKSKHKNKEKSKNKNKEKEKEKVKEKDNNEDINNINENRNSTTSPNKAKQKELLENEKKTDIENNNENLKINKKKSKLKKFLCCFINNGDSSIEND